MLERTRQSQALAAEIAITGSLTERFGIELLSGLPNGLERIDDLTEQTLQHLTEISWPRAWA